MSDTNKEEQGVFLGGPVCGRVFSWDEEEEGPLDCMFSKDGKAAYHRTEEFDSKGRTVFKFTYLT